MKIVEHKKYKNLQLPSFSVDYDLNPDNVYFPLRHLTLGYKFIAIVGKSGSGKTSFLYSLLTSKKILKRIFHNVILFMPRQSRSSLKKDIFADLSEEKQYDEMNFENLATAQSQIKKFAQEGENTLLILDDVGSYLKEPAVSKLLLDLISNKRHYHVTIVILAQVYNTMPLPIRKGINSLVLFYRPTKSELDNVFTELLELTDKTKINEIVKYTYQDKHDYLFIDVESQRIYRNNLEIIFEEDP